MAGFSELKLRSRGADVRRLQVLLNKVLQPQRRVRENGYFGGHTQSLVRQFQRQYRGLKNTGRVDEATWDQLQAKARERGLLRAPVIKAGKNGLPDTAPLSEEEMFDLYEKYIATAPRGNTAPVLQALAKGEKVILGLRVLTNSRKGVSRSKRKKYHGKIVTNGLGVYDDRFVVMWKDKDVYRVREFTGNTEPSSYYEDGWTRRRSEDRRRIKHSNKPDGRDAGGPRKNGKTRKDLGRMPEGVYPFKKSRDDELGRILRPQVDIIAERDLNHDGWINAADARLVTKPEKLSSDRTMYFHMGNRTRTASAGCQTFHPTQWSRFWRTLAGQSNFHYVLMENRDPQEVLHEWSQAHRKRAADHKCTLR